MTWEHCGETLLDDQSCTCGYTKEAWTVEFGVTREFKVARGNVLRFYLLNGSGEPVAGEPYRVVPEDGATQEGELNEDGYAKIRLAGPNRAWVSFPNRGRGSVVPAEGDQDIQPEEGGDPQQPPRWSCPPQRRNEFLLRGKRLKLVDPWGEPMADLACTVVSGDQEHEASTDAQGYLLTDGLPQGEPVRLRVSDGRWVLFRRDYGVREELEYPDPKEFDGDLEFLDHRQNGQFEEDDDWEPDEDDDWAFDDPDEEPDPAELEVPA